MSERTSYKRNPAIHCWIKHIEEGKYDENENVFLTIFGKVKRVRLIATIIEKNEKLIAFNLEIIIKGVILYSSFFLFFFKTTCFSLKAIFIEMVAGVRFERTISGL